MKSKRVYAPKSSSTRSRRTTGMVGAAGTALAAIGTAMYRRYTKKKPAGPKKAPGNRRRTQAAASVGLARKVARLESQMKNTTSKLVYKWDNKDTLRASAGTAVYGWAYGIGTNIIEQALAQARYFDPTNPGTLITGSLATPTYQQSIDVSVFTKCLITNNYQVPVMVTYGIVTPKGDVTLSPNSALGAGLTDQGNPDSSSTLISYRDSKLFTDLWKVKSKLYSKVLMPGKSINLTHAQSRFMYDPSYTDSETETFVEKNKNAVFIYRIQGTLSHDSSVSTEQGMSPAGIDVYVHSVYTIKYNSGGASINTIVLAENASQSFTNAAVRSQVVVDNQSYSIA